MKVYRNEHLLASHLRNRRIVSRSQTATYVTLRNNRRHRQYTIVVCPTSTLDKDDRDINTPDHSKSVVAHVWHANNSETFPRSERTRNTCRLRQSPAILDLHLLVQVWRTPPECNAWAAIFDCRSSDPPSSFSVLWSPVEGMKARCIGALVVLLYTSWRFCLPAPGSMSREGKNEVIVARAFPDMLSFGMVVFRMGCVGCGTIFEESHQDRLSPSSSAFVGGVPLLWVWSWTGILSGVGREVFHSLLRPLRWGAYEWTVGLLPATYASWFWMYYFILFYWL